MQRRRGRKVVKLVCELLTALLIYVSVRVTGSKKNIAQNECKLNVCYDGYMEDCVHKKLGNDGVLVKIGDVISEICNSKKFSSYKIHLNNECKINLGLPELEEKELFAVLEKKNKKRKYDKLNLEVAERALKTENIGKSCPVTEDDVQGLCSIDALHSVEGDIVDLLMDPEGYTAYPAQHSHKVWAALYGYACSGNVKKMSSDTSPDDYFSMYPVHNVIEKNCNLDSPIYRLISGLHTSISIHLCGRWCDDKNPVWRNNKECYDSRVNRYADRKQNFVYLQTIVTLALKKVVPLLENIKNSTDLTNTREQQLNLNTQISKLTAVLNSWNPGNKYDILNNLSITSRSFLKTFDNNVNTIFDCIQCTRCRLWGKLQIKGLITAIDILTLPRIDTIPENNLVALVNLSNNLFKGTHFICSFECNNNSSSLLNNKFVIFSTIGFSFALFFFLFRFKSLSSHHSKYK